MPKHHQPAINQPHSSLTTLLFVFWVETWCSGDLTFHAGDAQTQSREQQIMHQVRDSNRFLLSMSFQARKPMVVGETHHLRKPPYMNTPNQIFFGRRITSNHVRDCQMWCKSAWKEFACPTLLFGKFHHPNKTTGQLKLSSNGRGLEIKKALNFRVLDSLKLSQFIPTYPLYAFIVWFKGFLQPFQTGKDWKTRYGRTCIPNRWSSFEPRPKHAVWNQSWRGQSHFWTNLGSKNVMSIRLPWGGDWNTPFRWVDTKTPP